MRALACREGKANNPDTAARPRIFTLSAPPIEERDRPFQETSGDQPT
jgi:hypothetical protein